MQITKTFSNMAPPRYVVIGADSSTSMPNTVQELVDLLESYKRRGVDARVYRYHGAWRYGHRSTE